MIRVRTTILIFAFTILLANSYAQSGDQVLQVKSTKDFQITGNGSNPLWKQANWVKLESSVADNRLTHVKLLYSETGIYFLFQNRDSIITSSRYKHFEKLWLEDVVEVFLWPDTTATLYFEYELSPRNYELPLMVPNFDGNFMGWLPWNYEGSRRIKHFTHVVSRRGSGESVITEWFAEFFIPFQLLNPLRNVPPKPGSVWKANMYRIDYDTPTPVLWYWCKTESNFHQYTKFGTLKFE